MTCGVPQRLILGPLLFDISVLLLAYNTVSNKVCYQNYADDTQILIHRQGTMIPCKGWVDALNKQLDKR